MIRNFFVAGIVLAFLAPGGFAIARDQTMSAAGTSTDNRDNFVTRTNAQLDNYDAQVTQLKSRRDAHARNTPAYQDLDSRVTAMQAKIKEIRDDLDSLKSASGDSWRQYESKVNDRLADLKSLSREKLAE
jgi:hypothetical protein